MVCRCSQTAGTAPLQLAPCPLYLQVVSSKDPVANAAPRDYVVFDCGSTGDMDLGG